MKKQILLLNKLKKNHIIQVSNLNIINNCPGIEYDANIKKFIYLNSNMSGIGDRIMDIILIYTYSKYLKYDELLLAWGEDKNDMIYAPNIYANARKTKTPFREYDYMLKNLLTYITFPIDIKFVNRESLNNTQKKDNIYIFTQYMGLGHSVYTFVESFLSKISDSDKNDFIETYFKNFNMISFKNIPQHIVDTFNNNDIITIHLRRGDKNIDDGGVSNNLNIKYTDELNLMTEKFIYKCIDLGYNNICMISDEKNIRNDYCTKFKNKCNIIYFDGDDISQTYYDLFCLSYSKKILLSQLFSTFSILGSLINTTNLYYLFESGLIM